MPGEGAGHEIRELNRQWSNALQSGNAEELDRILADEFYIVGSSGRRLNKRQYIQFACASTTSISPDVPEDEVHVYGDAAIAFGRTSVAGTFRGQLYGGKPEIYTNVFARRGDTWLAIASHATFVGAPRENARNQA